MNISGLPITCAVAISLLTSALSGQDVATYFNRNIPSECEARMAQFVAAGKKIVCVAFPPAGGNRWTVVTEDGDFFNRGISLACHTQMRALYAAGHKIKCVAYPPAGGDSWSIVTDRSFVNRNVPAECDDRMDTFHRGGQRVTWVAFPPVGGNSFSVVTDQGTFFNRNVPAACASRMSVFKSAGHKIRCVAFPVAGGNRWSIVTDKGFYNWGTPTYMHRVMRAASQFPGGPLRMVACTPDGMGYSVVTDTHPDAAPSIIDRGDEYFSLDKFAENLKAKIRGVGAKAAFTIRHGDVVRSYSEGAKRTAFSSPAQGFSIYDRFNPASVSKTITGVAVLRALQNEGEGSDLEIGDYLPTSWTVHESVKKITFRQLLSHRSGFRGDGTSTETTYAKLRTLAEAGVSVANQNQKYDNVNYGLARIVCAYLDGYSEAGVTDHAKATADHFTAFVQRYLMDPCGIPSVRWKPDTVEPTIFYPHPAGASTGTTYGDWSKKPGAAGLVISMAELDIFLDRLYSSAAILSADMRRDELEGNFLGWGARQAVKHGSYLWKGGFFPGSRNVNCQLTSALCRFDNGIQLAMVVNGPVMISELSGSIRVSECYNQAWVTKTVKILAASTSIPNVTTTSILVHGENLDAVNRATFGPYSITSTDYTDPTRPYIRAMSPIALFVHLPQGIDLATHALRLHSGLSSSNSVNVAVVTPSRAAIVMPTQPVAGRAYSVCGTAGDLAANAMWLVVSPSSAPSSIPGVVNIGIGDNFSKLIIWPQIMGVHPGTKAGRLVLPSHVSLRGQVFYFQGVFATALPLATTGIKRVQFQ